MSDKPKMGMGKKIGLGCGGAVVLFIVIAVIGGIASDGKGHAPQAPHADAQAPAQIPAISASALHQDYQKNEVAADNKWKGKTIEVSGKVSRISKDAFENMHVYLAVSGGGFEDIDCKMDDSLKDQVSNINKGQVIKIQGEVTGAVLGMVGVDGKVIAQ